MGCVIRVVVSESTLVLDFLHGVVLDDWGLFLFLDMVLARV